MIGSGRFKAMRGPRGICSRQSGRRPPQIIGVRAFDPDRYDVARAQRPARRDVHGAVDQWRVPLSAALRLARVALVDDDLEALADLGGEFLLADRLRASHETLVAARFDFVWHG